MEAGPINSEESQRRKEEAERLAYIAELEAKNRALEQRLTKSNTRGHAVVKLFEVPASEVEVSPENFLARGGFGDVHVIEFKGLPHARWPSPRRVAVKCVQCSQKDYNREVKRVRKEARVLHAVAGHPHIISLYGVCVEPGSLRLVMELAERGSLRDLLQGVREEGQTLSMEKRFCILAGIVFGMQELHSKQIVHKDLKAGNVLINDSFMAKLADFGLSEIETQSTSFSASGPAGTTAYKAPELLCQPEGGSSDEDEAELPSFTPECDMYSFGIVAWEILTTEIAWDKVHDFTIIQKVAKGKRPTLKGTKMHFPTDEAKIQFFEANFVDFVQRAWDQHRENRPSFEDLTQELHRMPDAMRYSGMGEVAPLTLVTVDGRPILPTSLDGNEFHGFLSHKQAGAKDKETKIQMAGGAQDPVGCIRLELKCYLEWANLFLDVESKFKIGDLEDAVANSRGLILYVSGQVFESFYVVDSELMKALSLGIPVVVVRETDERHGGASRAEFRRRCVESEQVTTSAAKHGWDSGKVAAQLFDEGLILEWHRDRGFKNVTIKALAEWLTGQQLTWLNGEPMTGTASTPNHAIQPPEKDHHIYLSDNHPRLREIAVLLQEKWSNLRLLLGGDASIAAQTCDNAVVMLTDNCFVGEAGGRYCDDVAVWVEANGLPRTMLFKEDNSSSEDGVPFDTLWQQCPERLKDQEGPINLLSKIAAPWSVTPLYGNVCLERIVGTIVPPSDVAHAADDDEELSRAGSSISLHAGREEVHRPPESGVDDDQGAPAVAGEKKTSPAEAAVAGELSPLKAEVNQFSPAEAIAKLTVSFGAKDYDDEGPPTETSVGFDGREDITSLDGELINLLVSLPVEKLSFYKCKNLESLPERFGDLKSLTSLDLCYCKKLVSLPERFGELKSLISLELSFCEELVSLSEGFGDLVNLQTLKLESCWELKSLPERFGDLKSLTSLNLRYCQSLQSLPERFGDLKNLKELNMYGCEVLQSLPERFGELKSLTSLDLSGEAYNPMKLESLPERFGQLKNLETLTLSSCYALGSLPERFGDLKSLTSLNLSGDDWNPMKIESLPERFGDLKNLKTLVMFRCEKLVALPERFGQLTSLETLYLDNTPAGRTMPAALKAQLEAQGCKSAGNGW